MNINFYLRKFFFFNLALICFFSNSLHSEEKITPHVLVSVAPHKFFVEKIVGSTVRVDLIVPAGASAHTYEPSPKQMLSATSASLWFRIGEPFENKIIATLKSHNSKLQVVDLRQNLDLISGDPKHRCACHKGSEDLHFWLSARMAQIQAKTMADALIEAYPMHAELYKANLAKFHEELVQLDLKIQEIFKSITNRTILVSHPAYAYFCRDYNLNQYSIECEGKDPTPQQLNAIMNLARDKNIKSIFIQKQYSNKGARLIAEEIHARIITLDPYSENYIESMLTIAHAFAEG